MPASYVITLGNNLGTVTLNYNASSVPDRFVVIYNGVVVIDTGYRGGSTYQSQLNSALADYNLPPSPIVGIGAGSASFFKNSSVPTATVEVYGPLPGTAWNFTLGCPV
jgi:hypothetical protein